MNTPESKTFTIPIPEGVTVEQKDTLIVTGPEGSLERVLSHPFATISIADKKITVTPTAKKRRNTALAGTYASHIRNMITGVTQGYVARLKVFYSHFPMKLQVSGSTFEVQNFIGERFVRTVEILDGVTVEVKKDEVLVSGADKESVGQTAGRIEQIATVRGFDRRIFQDGIHLISKTKPKEA